MIEFDTGLCARAFAQAKMAQFITLPGFIVFPNGEIKTWKPGGVIDRQTMIIWGPAFPGEKLTDIINSERKDEALNALLFWLTARIIIEENPDINCSVYPGTNGAYVVTQKRYNADFPTGTVFFPPQRLISLVQRCQTERWTHPDLKGAQAISFEAGAMLYRIFCGVPPFPNNNREELMQDIREGVFVPPFLAAPGIDPDLASLISNAMNSTASNVSPQQIRDFFKASGSKPVSSWIKTLDKNELDKVLSERQQYNKKNSLKVKTRRFVNRNTTLLAVSLISLVLLLFIIRGGVRHRSEMPTTRGMTAIEVVYAYYNAFNALNHVMMEACLTGRISLARDDINTVMNFFVISRVRQAYELFDPIFPAAEWLNEGRPVTDRLVFGITDLAITTLWESDTQASFEANYILWLPGTYFDEEGFFIKPDSRQIRDRLELVFQNELWRIRSIERVQLPY